MSKKRLTYTAVSRTDWNSLVCCVCGKRRVLAGDKPGCPPTLRADLDAAGDEGWTFDCATRCPQHSRNDAVDMDRIEALNDRLGVVTPDCQEV